MARSLPAATVRDHDRSPLPAAILHLQRQAGNEAVSDLVSSGISALATMGELAALGAQLILKKAGVGIEVNENLLTDELFWIQQPSLRGEKLRPGSPEALRWLHIRDAVVRPLLRERRESEGAAAGGGPKPAAGGAPPGTVPADQIAAESGGSTVATQAGTSDKYFVQDVGRYRDIGDKDQPRVWLNKTSGANVCNVTSLTMGLVSLAGEAEVREKIIGLLRSKGMHKGASVEVGGTWVSLAEALDDAKLSSRITLIDLVTAAAIGVTGAYKDVTVPGTLARVAKESGIATKAEAIRGQPLLSTEKGRKLAQEMLAAGKRVIAATVNHYVYLLEIRADGALLHDPAGARVEPTLKGPLFLHSGNVRSMAYEWGTFDAVRRERAIRRVSTNPEVSAIVNRLAEIWSGPAADRKAALAALAKEHPGHFNTGSSNFYAITEFAENNLRLTVSLK